jgi:hypothetical protein
MFKRLLVLPGFGQAAELLLEDHTEFMVLA